MLCLAFVLHRHNQKTSAGGVLLRMRNGYMIEKLLVLLSYPW